MTKKGRWFWVFREKFIYSFSATRDRRIEYFLQGASFRKIFGLKLKPGEVRKVRLEWEE